MNSDRLVLLLESGLARHMGWIAAADAKTGFIFTADTAMLALLAATAPSFGKWTPFGVAATVPTVLLLVGSLGSLTTAVFPRTRGPKLSVIFFGGIAGRDIDNFRKDILSLDEAAYLEDLIQQCHINAQIAAAKYTWVKRAAIALYLAVAPWLLATFVLFRDR